MASKVVHLTEAGLQKIKSELEHLRSVERPAISAAVANARVLDESRIDTSSVQILNRVTLKNMKTGKTVEYTLVSESEANLKEGKLAIGTPIAQALLGHKKGDKVDVQVPSGMIPFEILDIAVADM